MIEYLELLHKLTVGLSVFIGLTLVSLWIVIGSININEIEYRTGTSMSARKRGLYLLAGPFFRNWKSTTK